MTPSSANNNTITKTNNITDTNTGRPLLFSLKENDELVRATFVVRPSKRNKSPYVADILMLEEEGQEPDTPREAIAHVPNLDMGGKCVPGVTLLLKPARNPKGVKVGANGVSPKYGTPKCEFITQLLHVDEIASWWTICHTYKNRSRLSKLKSPSTVSIAFWYLKCSLLVRTPS